MKSRNFRFSSARYMTPSSVAAVALLGLAGMGSPARADSLCPTTATEGGFGNSFSTSAESGACPTAVTMNITNAQNYAKLEWAPGAGGYSAGFTLGNLTGLSAQVGLDANSDQPYYILEFIDPSDSLGQANATDQIIMIEFQNSTVSGGAMDLDPNATLFNLYDNTGSGYYLEGGQHDTNTLAGWLSSDPSLAGDSLGGVWLAIGLAGGSGPAESVTVDSLDMEGGPASVPEPTSLLLLLTVVGATGLGVRHRQLRNHRS